MEGKEMERKVVVVMELNLVLVGMEAMVLVEAEMGLGVVEVAEMG